MSLDHEAIYEAYKSEAKPVVTIDDTGGAFDADGNSVTLDNTKIANARASLDSIAASVKYVPIVIKCLCSKSDMCVNGESQDTCVELHPCLMFDLTQVESPPSSFSFC